ncbi:hypothetical protein UT300007_24010 [Clostridium sp. CTA-7]
MKTCSKCKTKINFITILKSSYKEEGLIECDKCHSKFKIKCYLLIVIILIALCCITMNYLTRYYPTTLINNIIRITIAIIAVILVYTELALLLPWKEQ